MLTHQHKLNRKIYCGKIFCLLPEEWNQFWFSDEVMIRSHPFNHKLGYWSLERRSEFDREKKHSQGIGVIFWGLISLEFHGPLVAIDGSVNKISYLQLLKTHLKPELVACSYKPHFVQDNAKPHKARIVINWLENHNLILENWPSKSLDLNPIENCWYLLKHKLVHEPVCETSEDIVETVLELWLYLQDSYRENLINHLSKA
eukprot:NODE_231_length_12072_cov_0.605780.p3 type:complete len:202 gc:universal NODE_231_length_12072_cov_0.605780:11260-10655(-)